MWTRRVLLATLVAAAALMTMPRNDSPNAGFGASNLVASTLR